VTDRRTVELATSCSADFETNEWRFMPVSACYHVGAGHYLLVPTCQMDWQGLKARIEAEIAAMEAERN
jgi:hypothetical protein